MILKWMTDSIGWIAGPVARWLNFVAKVFLAAMMALTGVDVAMRYFLNQPIDGSYELTQYMMPMVIAFGLAYCALEDGHVQVELITARFSERGQHVMKALAYLAMLAIYGLIAWQAIIGALGMLRSGRYTEVLYIPIYPFVFVIALGCIALCLVVINKFLEQISLAVNS